MKTSDKDCMIITYYGRAWINRGMVANLPRSQPNRKNAFFFCPRSRLRIWSHEKNLAVPARGSLLILHSRAESIIVLESRNSSRFPQRLPFIYLYPQNAIGSVVEFIGLRNRVPMALTAAERRRVSSPQRSFSNWCCLFRYQGPNFVRISFPTPIIGTAVDMYDL